MRVKVEYAAQIKRAAGVGADDVELNHSATVAALLRAVAEKRGPTVRELLLDECGSPRRSLLLFVGDKQILTDAHAKLRDGDTITIMTPISGG